MSPRHAHTNGNFVFQDEFAIAIALFDGKRDSEFRHVCYDSALVYIIYISRRLSYDGTSILILINVTALRNSRNKINI